MCYVILSKNLKLKEKLPFVSNKQEENSVIERIKEMWKT